LVSVVSIENADFTVSYASWLQTCVEYRLTAWPTGWLIFLQGVMKNKANN